MNLISPTLLHRMTPFLRHAMVLLLIAADCCRSFAAEPLLIAGDGNTRFATHRYGRMIAADAGRVAVAYMSGDAVFGSRVAEIDPRSRRLISLENLGGRLVRGKADDHNFPSLVSDGRGALHAFYGCHSTPLLYRQKQPGSARWAEEREIAADATYPRAFCGSSNEIVAFFRQGHSSVAPVSFGYVMSQDGGATWSGFQPIIAEHLRDGVNAWPYVGGVLLRGDTVHLALSWWYYRADGKGRKEYDDPCYLTFSLDKREARDARGKSLPVPVPRAALTPLALAENLDVNDLCLDAAGNPAILLVDARRSRSVLARLRPGGGWQLHSEHPQDAGQNPAGYRFIQDLPVGARIHLCAAKAGGVELSAETPSGAWETSFTPIVEQGKVSFPQARWAGGQVDLLLSVPSGPKSSAEVWWHRVSVPWTP